MATERKVLYLDELRNRVAGQFDLDGKKHDVLQIDFETHQRLTASDGTADSLAAIRESVRKVAPTLTEEQLLGMNLDMAQAVLTLSGAGIAAVEVMFPNAVRPESSSTSPA